MRILILLLCIVTLFSQTITLTCAPCTFNQFQYCVTMNGGPFDDYEAQDSYCSDDPTSFPIEWQLSCSEQCSASCLLTQTNSVGGYEQECLSSSIGQQYQQVLNNEYGQSQGNPSAKYSWCQCQSSLGLLIGLIVAGVVVVGIIIVIVLFYRRKKVRQLLNDPAPYPYSNDPSRMIEMT